MRPLVVTAVIVVAGAISGCAAKRVSTACADQMSDCLAACPQEPASIEQNRRTGSFPDQRSPCEQRCHAAAAAGCGAADAR